jgi:hypothetical protein
MKANPKNPLNPIEKLGAIMILNSLIHIAKKSGKSYVTIDEIEFIKKGIS